MTAYKSYVICTSPRSGSTLLCKLLAQTGIAGHPGSYFHRPSLADWVDRYALSPAAAMSERDILSMVFRAVIAKGSRDTGMFGLRLQRGSFNYFAEQLAVLYPDCASDSLRFQAAFGPTLFIYLTRRDKADQAISFVKAHQTGLWHRAADGTELERLAPPQDPVYDEQALVAAYRDFAGFDREWEAWFKSGNIAPLRIAYDDLAAEPGATLAHILARLGLDRRAATDIEPGVAKLADATSEAWKARLSPVLADIRAGA